MNKTKTELVLKASFAVLCCLLMAACYDGGTSPAENEPDLPDAPVPMYDTIVDDRDGTEYRTVKIGEQWWMAENLKYEVEGMRKSYHNPYSGDSVEIDGYAYDWAMAMGLDSSYLELSAEVTGVLDPVHRGICPEGFHIPSKGEWQTLEDYADLHNGSENVSTSLRSPSKWKLSSYYAEVGTDRYGFSATPSDGAYNAQFISSTEIHREWRTDMAYFWSYQLACNKSHEFSNADKSDFYFVRCVKD